MNTFSRAALAALLLLVLVPRVEAGTATLVLSGHDRRLEITPAPGEEKLDLEQTAVRGTFTWRASETWTLAVDAAGVSSLFSPVEDRLTGFTDVRLRALVRPAGQWVIGVGAVIPSGMSDLAIDELTVSQAVWNPLFGMPVATFAEGPGWEVTVARGFSVGESVHLGLAASYLGHLEFSPAAGLTDDYRLGDEINGSAALALAAGANARVRLLAAYRTFGADRLGGEDVLEQGAQVDLAANLDLHSGPLFASLGGYLTRKEDNEILDSADPDATVQGTRAAGNTSVLEGRAGVLLGGRFGLYGQARLLKISDGDYEIPVNGDIVSFGPGLRIELSPGFSIDARASLVSGTGDDDLEYDGTSAVLTLEYTR